MLVAAAALLAASGCSQQDIGTFKRLGMPEPVTDRAVHTLHLWQGAWIAAFVIGFLVWGLIIWAVIAYRKRDDSIPKQTRYNIPVEVMYTVVPVIIVLVLFFYTVRTQDAVLATDEKVPPDQVINVVGQQWSWTFNYLSKDEIGTDVYDTGTPAAFPTLYLPKGERIGIRLTSPDVIHSFFVPAFLFKEDVFPGKENYFEFTPTKEGTYAGKCAELCGAYHSRMLFTVKIVSPDTFEKHLHDLEAKGHTGQATGGVQSTTEAGLEPEGEGAK